MDPNACLEEIRRLTAEGLERNLTFTETTRLVELQLALDEWITKGGYLPEAWTRRSAWHR